MEKNMIYHAWFSQKQKEFLYSIKYYDHVKPHTNIYLTIDDKEVEVTEVSQNKREHEKYFPDSVYLGQVKKWVRIKY